MKCLYVAEAFFVQGLSSFLGKVSTKTGQFFAFKHPTAQTASCIK
jgi:hypothetical protein